MPRPGRAPRPPQATQTTASTLSPVLAPSPSPLLKKGIFRLRNGVACVLVLSGLCASFVASHGDGGGKGVDTLAPFSLRRTTIHIDPNARGWARPGRMDGSAQAFRPLSTQGKEDESGFHRNLVFDPTRLEKGATDAGVVESTPEVDALKETILEKIEDPGGCGHGGRCFNEKRPEVVQLPAEIQHAHQDEHAADLHVHKSSERGECWSHFDLGAIEIWDQASTMMCLPTEGWSPEWSPEKPDAPENERISEIEKRIGPIYSAFLGAAAGENGLLSIVDATLSTAVNGEAHRGWLRCRVTNDAHLPPATAPHTLCDGANVVLDIKALNPTNCLPSRTGYKCDGPSVHWIFPPNSLMAKCSVLKTKLLPESFPRDHLRDLFAGWAGVNEFPVGAQSAEGKAVLIIARERSEHANLFHATSDWLNAFISLSVAGIVDSRSGARKHMGDVQLLLLDEQSGPFEENFMKPIFSPSHPVLRVSQLKERNLGLLHMQRALFVPPGYSSMMLSHVTEEGDCHAGTQLLTGFRAFVLGGLGIDPARAPPAVVHAADPAPLVRVTVISRRPYNVAGIEHPFVGRQIDNEDAFIAALEAHGTVLKVRRIDLATLSMQDQVKLIAEETDILVGMHGAALTHALYLPPWAAVIEMWPKERDMWRCFEHLSTMAGLAYERWANTDPANFRNDERGDYTKLNIDAVVERVVNAAVGVKERWANPSTTPVTP